jgi:hypothetical protein
MKDYIDYNNTAANLILQKSKYKNDLVTRRFPKLYQNVTKIESSKNPIESEPLNNFKFLRLPSVVGLPTTNLNDGLYIQNKQLFPETQSN